MNIFKNLFLVLLVVASIQSILADANYTIDKEHTSLEFEITHLMISTVKGRFDDFEGSIKLDDKKNTLLSIEGKAKAESINTNQEKRDKHLKSPDFFDAKKFPTLDFEATGIKLTKGKSSKVKATLSIHGVKKTVTVNLIFKGIVTDPWGAEKAVVDAETTINRKDFGLNWNEALETGGVMVGEDVKIIVHAQANLK